MISVRYAITKADYVHFYTHVLWDAKDRKRKRIKAIIRQLIYTLIFAALLFYFGTWRFDKFTILLLALIAGISFLPFLSAKTDMEQQAAAIAEDPDNANIFTEYILIGTDAGLQIKTEYQETKTFWKGIIKKSETETHIFLFESGLQAIIIPKSAFKDEEESEAFHKLLSRNLSLQAELKDDIDDGK